MTRTVPSAASSMRLGASHVLREKRGGLRRKWKMKKRRGE